MTPATVPRPAAPVITPFHIPAATAAPAARKLRPAGPADLSAALGRRGYQVRDDAPPGGCQVSEPVAGPCRSPGPNRHGGIRLCDAHAYALGLPAPGLTG